MKSFSSASSTAVERNSVQYTKHGVDRVTPAYRHECFVLKPVYRKLARGMAGVPLRDLKGQVSFLNEGGRPECANKYDSAKQKRKRRMRYLRSESARSRRPGR